MSVALPPLSADLTWTVALRDADSGELLASVAPETVVKTASVGKVFLLIEAARALEAGEADADEPLRWDDDEYVEDSGLWYRLRQRTLPLADVLALIAAVSDNLATNVAVRRFGIDAIARTTRGLGVTASGLLDRVRSERTPAMPPTLSRGCAAELSHVFALLHRGEAVSSGVSDAVLHWLAANVDTGLVADPFVLDALAHDEADQEVSVFNKTGAISTARADVGLVRGPRRAIAYAAAANWSEGGPDRLAGVVRDLRAIGEVVRDLTV
ncbi:serine hydrolase [Nigerium massiliense]|uniref:serine hydrolase n=1 Tax=Nigerium massiliense TaxID=1522317 RepID=UPI00058C10DB|nr:serine hydrolase [Nigerium massiliense]